LVKDLVYKSQNSTPYQPEEKIPDISIYEQYFHKQRRKDIYTWFSGPE